MTRRPCACVLLPVSAGNEAMYTAAAFWSKGRGSDSIKALSVIEFIVGIPAQGFECLNELVKRLLIVQNRVFGFSLFMHDEEGLRVFSLHVTEDGPGC